MAEYTRGKATISRTAMPISHGRNLMSLFLSAIAFRGASGRSLYRQDAKTQRSSLGAHASSVPRVSDTVHAGSVRSQGRPLRSEADDQARRESLLAKGAQGIDPIRHRAVGPGPQ